MYNHWLDTFIMAANCGSFSKAAAELYITSSAVIQQINALESNLGCKLFLRTNQGISLTPAGKYFYGETKTLIQSCANIRTQLKQIESNGNMPVRLGIGAAHPLQLFYDIWPRYLEKYPNSQIKTTEFSESETNLEKIDLVEGIYFYQPWQHNYLFYPLCNVPYCCVLSANHPLAEKDILEIDDIKKYTTVILGKGVAPTLDILHDALRQQGVLVKEVDDYSDNVYFMCLAQQHLLIVPGCWHSYSSQLKLVPVNWNYVSPYGFFIAHHSSPVLSQFIDFLQALGSLGNSFGKPWCRPL